ncbi:mitochondrial 54S ribosomal protein MRP49 [Sugiyamaella lignohabitans]|uniref:Mitochondrial 54S ribosomal protein MRP49 n=1 Tax=Sugiyamaella lignohabitans TaxID=796027 RepID=A0A167DB96_9ASCO|nr:mitochondrial 54S ribosomal protein MRP49 [Sugiyamaella lignohabitans]ANB12709.1 mitochondrial 54S ribosomal protein MRP49 [Sugiyamaella lignohabitans]
MSGLNRQLARLNSIAKGAGSVRVPTNVTGLSLRLSTRRPAKGAKSFWRENLPQVQFHNPSLPITVKKVTAEQEAAGEKISLSISFEDGTSKSVETTERTSEQILEDFVAASGASQVPENEIPVLKRPSFHDL